MIFPTGSPVTFQPVGESPDEIQSITANRERHFLLVLRRTQLQVYSSEPEVLLCSYHRSSECVEEKGSNVGVVWKTDSTAVAVSTSKTFLMFYRISIDLSTQCYSLKEQRDSQFHRSSQELFVKTPIPRVEIFPAFAIQLLSKPTKILSLREEIVVALKDGWLRRIYWSGATAEEMSLSLEKIPFGQDQLQTKADYTSPNVYVVDMCYSPLVGGFCVVLSDGRCGLLTSTNVRFPPTHVHGVWAPWVNDAVCASVNHKYRLLVFGQANGDASCFSIDEITGALVLSHRVQLSTKDFPAVTEQLGKIICLSWSPYGEVLAVAWEKGGISVWSVFGSLLWCFFAESGSPLVPFALKSTVRSMDWGPEGFRLWWGYVAKDSEVQKELIAHGDLQSLKCLRSTACGFPSIADGRSIVLFGDSSVHISLTDGSSGEQMVAGCSHWDTYKVPVGYVGSCWPLRYCVVDLKQQLLAVAGKRGLAHCNLKTRKWRLFRNETEEKELTVSGGLCLWRDFIVATCFNGAKPIDEIRFYNRHCNLDNAHCTSVPAGSQTLLMLIQGDVLLTFDIEGRVSLYEISTLTSNSLSKVGVVKFAELLIAELVVHPVCVTAMQLTSLSHEAADKQFCEGYDTLLINIGGKLVMLHPDKKQTVAGATNQLNQPMLVASFVENMWCCPSTNGDKPHLSKALWISCGSKGMKVWMPLFPKQSGMPQHSFISKRIMLPFETTVNPISISFNQCLISGLECLTHMRSDPSTKSPSFYLQRNSEVYLHHILRQLLKRNLGLYALEIAMTCLSLPYFSHVLELLLHTVLEEEATSCEPIPDPLLPRVVAFIQEFPQFLQTVVHCARKTEMALWSHLFSAVGNPKDLFEVCLRENRFDTAASYLIVLQNMESASESKEDAKRLLEATMNNNKFEIAKEIIRFLKSIDPEDMESPPRTPMYAKMSRQQLPSMVSPPIVSDEAVESFLYQPVGYARQKQNSIGSTSVPLGLDVVQNGVGPLSPQSPSQTNHRKVSRARTMSMSEPRAIANAKVTTVDYHHDLVNPSTPPDAAQCTIS